MAASALFLFLGRVFEVRNIPGINAVALSALLTELPVVWIVMTAGAGEIRVEKGMIHGGNLTVLSLMFSMALQTVAPFLVKTNGWTQLIDVAEVMALATGGCGNPLQRFVADSTGVELAVARNQVARLGRVLGVKERCCYTDGDEQYRAGYRFF